MYRVPIAHQGLSIYCQSRAVYRCTGSIHCPPRVDNHMYWVDILPIKGWQQWTDVQGWPHMHILATLQSICKYGLTILGCSPTLQFKECIEVYLIIPCDWPCVNIKDVLIWPYNNTLIIMAHIISQTNCRIDALLLFFLAQHSEDRSWGRTITKQRKRHHDIWLAIMTWSQTNDNKSHSDEQQKMLHWCGQCVDACHLTITHIL